MNWISEVFKNVTVSKTLTGACCITGISLLIGPLLFPLILDPLPKSWATIVLGVSIFSGCLQLFWGLQYVKSFIVGFVYKKAKKARSQNLSELEVAFICELGKLADEGANLRNIDYKSSPFSKLEMLELCKSLNDKDLLDISAFDENVVYLSGNGRKKALEIIKSNSVKN